MGTVTSGRCAARSPEGRPGGCRGKAKNTSPRTCGIGASAAACEAMRPPKEWPPTSRGRPGAASRAADAAERTVSQATGLDSVPPPPLSM